MKMAHDTLKQPRRKMAVECICLVHFVSWEVDDESRWTVINVQACPLAGGFVISAILSDNKNRGNAIGLENLCLSEDVIE